MAKIFDKIVQSATEPSKNDIWLKDGQLKAFQNGQWESLSPQGQGGQGGGEVPGEVSSEHPVKIIELTQEEVMTGKELDITVEEYLKHSWIIRAKNGPLVFNFKLDSVAMYTDMGKTYVEDVYTYIFNNTYNQMFTISIMYGLHDEDSTISLTSLNCANNYGQINFILSDVNTNKAVLNDAILNHTYSAQLSIKNINIIGTYCNGIFTGFAEGKIKQYNINAETGEVSEKLSIDIETLAGLEARIAALEGV